MYHVNKFFLMNCHWMEKKYACRFFKMSRFVNHFSFWGNFFPLFLSFSMLLSSCWLEGKDSNSVFVVYQKCANQWDFWWTFPRFRDFRLCFKICICTIVHFQRSVTPTRKCIQRFGWSQRRRPTRPHQQKSSARAQPQRNPKSKTSSMSGLEVSGYFYWTRSTSSKSSRS